MSTSNGFGSVTWWGFTPSVNLTEFADHSHQSLQSEATHLETSGSVIESDHVNVLMVGGGDLRQVLVTLAHAHKYTSKPIHFYLAECCLEVFARHMLFLTLLFEPPERLGLQVSVTKCFDNGAAEKVELFLELYGNTLVRAHTSEYLKKTATELIKMVTDQEYLKSVIPLLDISALKFKERDLLEGIFKFWRNPDHHTFDIAKHWEGRLRHYLGSRYDTRSGVFDWDYHMKLSEMVTVVNAREYCEWRESGVAFQLRSDAPYECPNRTLASGMIVTAQGGDKVARRGYWGDIVNSPYLSFGVYSENKELFKKNNGKHIKSSVNVSEYNMTSLIHTLTTGEAYNPSSTNNATASKTDMDTIQEIDEEDEDQSLTSKCQSNGHTRTGPLFNGSCFISFLPLNSPTEMNKKAKFKKLFNIAYFSNSMVHHLNSGIESTFSQDCILVLETARFMLDITKEQRAEFSKKVTSMAGSINFKVATLHATEKEPDHLVFVRGSSHS